MWNSVVRVKFGERLENANNRSRRDKPRVPKEEIDEAVLHYVPGNPVDTGNHVQQSQQLNHVDFSVQPKIILPPSPPAPTPAPPPQSNRNPHRRNSSPDDVPRHLSARKLLPAQPPRIPHPRMYITDEEDGGEEADVDELPTPPSPIYATRLTSDSWENQQLRRGTSPERRKRRRRRLPLTPDLPMHGELPQLFIIPHADV
uniref:Uncharacterized protein n=1 Tax=Caenorhabditis japonica TaxID=281687 RepID=A0A8R1ILC4_CAEJA